MSVSEYMYEFAPLLTQLPLKLALDNTDQGGLEVRFVPLEREDDEEAADLFVSDPTELLGKSWTYRIHIGKLQGLGFPAKRAYVQYSIFGEVIFPLLYRVL